MINIHILKKDDFVSKITIKGHSMYAESGSDNVCSSISSIAITTVNGCIRIDENSIIYNESDGFLEIEIKKNNEVIRILIENMISLFTELEGKYPKNIKTTYN